MRRTYKEVLLLLFCLLIGCALPALVGLIFGHIPIGEAEQTDDSRILLFSCEEEDEPRELSLRALLVGTLAAYNASDTPIESLKAQAVALRSRALCLLGCCRGEGSICDSPSHGLVCADESELISLWGEDEASARLAMAEEAVRAVENEVLCYGEDYVLALTHSSSEGKTRAMEGYPYLTSVTTPEASASGEDDGEAEDGERGYGLSRAGAALYAEQGLDYREILAHYFPQTTLTVL